ncbi:MAG: hypothetical protein RL748_4430, partial [Pseudomonadota bacterium]
IPKALEYFQYAQTLEREKAAFGNVPGNLALRLVEANASVPLAPAGPGASAPVRNLILPVPNAVRARSNGEALPAIIPNGNINNPAAYPSGHPGNLLPSNPGNLLPLPGARPFVDPLSQPRPATSYAPPAVPPGVPSAPTVAPANAQFEAGYQAALASIQAQQGQARVRESKASRSDKKASRKATHRSRSGKVSHSARANSGISTGNALQQALAALGAAKSGNAPQLAPLPPVAQNTAGAGYLNPATASQAYPGTASVTPNHGNPAWVNPPAPDWRSSATLPAAPSQAAYAARPAYQEPAVSNAAAAPVNTAEAPSLLSRLSQSLSGKAKQAQPAPNAVTLPASGNRERTVAEEIQDIELKFATTLDLGAAYRNRSGEVGMNRLSEVEMPLEFKTSFNYNHHLTLRMTPVLLSAGEMILADPVNITRFGSGALGPFIAKPYPSEFIQDSGLALAVAYGDDNLRVDLGSSPLGFKVANVVGGISYKHTVDELTLKASLNRRPVTDSVLSYAGARDPLDGSTWGGVVKTGVRLDGNYGSETLGMYGGFGIASLTGRRVKSNTAWEATGGAYWRAWQSINHQLTVGLNLNALGYHDNLSHFNLGHGGYFSPQRYLSLGVPIDAAGRFGKLSYQIGLDLGVRHINQDSAKYFPNDPLLQAQWEARIAALPTTSPVPDYFRASYKGDNSSGTGANLRASFEYLLAPQFALGGRFSFDNSRNYTQQTGLLYLRYAFTPLPTPVLFPPRTLQALYLGDPL